MLVNFKIQNFSISKITLKYFISLLFIISTFFSFAQQRDEMGSMIYSFRYQKVTYEGNRVEITDQLRSLKNQSKFVYIPLEYKVYVNKQFKKLSEQAIPRYFKKEAIVFLDELYKYEEFLDIYQSSTHMVVQELRKDMRRLDFKFEKEYTKAKTLYDRAINEISDNTERIDLLKDEVTNTKTKLACHRWMKSKFEHYTTLNSILNPDPLIAEFLKEASGASYDLFKQNKVEKLSGYLQTYIIEFYHLKALSEIDIDSIELNYIDKI